MEKNGGILCLTADHGNSDDMNEHKKDGSVAMGADGGRIARSAYKIANFAIHCKICLKLYKSCSRFVLYGTKRKIHQKNPAVL